MVRCDEFYEKWRRMGNFCEKHPETARLINNYLEFVDQIDARDDITPEVKQRILGMSEGAVYPLMMEKNADIKEKVILALKKDSIGENRYGKFVKHKVPTARDVERLIAIERGEANKPIETIQPTLSKEKLKEISIRREQEEKLEKEIRTVENKLNSPIGRTPEITASKKAWINLDALGTFDMTLKDIKCPCCGKDATNLKWVCCDLPAIKSYEIAKEDWAEKYKKAREVIAELPPLEEEE